MRPWRVRSGVWGPCSTLLSCAVNPKQPLKLKSIWNIKKKDRLKFLRLPLLGNRSYILLVIKQFGLNFLSLKAKGVLSSIVTLVKATFISESMAVWKLEGSGAKECWKWKGSCWITSSNRDSFKDGETESQRGDVCACAWLQEWERDLDLTSTSLSLASSHLDWDGLSSATTVNVLSGLFFHSPSSSSLT